VSTIRTQDQALTELHRLGAIVDHQAQRYAGAGSAIQADAARALAAAFRELAAVYDRVPSLYDGRKAARWLATAAARDAAELNQLRAQQWDHLADAAQAEADRVAKATAALFAEIPGADRHPSAARHLRGL
jgi:cellulase/cellobiase CelA1